MPVYQCSIEHVQQGQAVVNVIGFARTDLLGGETPAEAAVVAEQVAIAWKARIMPPLVNTLRFERVTARGMVNGEVSGVSIATAVTGASTQTGLPTFAAARVILSTSTPGRAGRGRTGIGGVSEIASETALPNTLTAVYQSALQGTLTNFVNDLAALTPTIFPVVISRVLGSVPRVTPIASPVIAVSAQASLGTRVSRLR